MHIGPTIAGSVYGFSLVLIEPGVIQRGGLCTSPHAHVPLHRPTSTDLGDFALEASKKRACREGLYSSQMNPNASARESVASDFVSFEHFLVESLAPLDCRSAYVALLSSAVSYVDQR